MSHSISHQKSQSANFEKQSFLKQEKNTSFEIENKNSDIFMNMSDSFEPIAEKDTSHQNNDVQLKSVFKADDTSNDDNGGRAEEEVHPNCGGNNDNCAKDDHEDEDHSGRGNGRENNNGVGPNKPNNTPQNGNSVDDIVKSDEFQQLLSELTTDIVGTILDELNLTDLPKNIAVGEPNPATPAPKDNNGMAHKLLDDLLKKLNITSSTPVLLNEDIIQYLLNYILQNLTIDGTLPKGIAIGEPNPSTPIILTDETITKQPADTINVVEECGLIGNGTVDNTENLKKAIATAKAEGKALWLPEGVYAFSGEIDLDGVQIMSGSNKSVLLGLDDKSSIKGENGQTHIINIEIVNADLAA